MPKDHTSRTQLVVGILMLVGLVTFTQAQPGGQGAPQVVSTANAPQGGERQFQYERPLIGADISWVPSQEDRGTTFKDQGVEKDVLKILADHKFNWIRLRLFVGPTATNGYSRQGYCGLEQTLAMAKRIEAAGMKFLLDFHYSDTWADPGKQFTPASWQGLSDDALADKIYEYNRDVLKRFIAEGVTPEMVQIGNEIHNGFVWPQGRIQNSPETFGTLLRRASEAVRDVDPKIKIMVHPALGGDNKRSVAFFDLVLSHKVVFDVIGQSYYPEHHGNLDALRNNLTDLATRYRKPIVVVEYNEHAKEVNEIVRDLPDGLGWGTFIWEATSPRWGKLFDRTGATTEKIDIYPAFFESVDATATAGDPAGSIKVIRDIAYREGDSDAWRLDLAMPAEEPKELRPALVIVHGGGWRGGSRTVDVFQDMMTNYAKKGYVTVNIDYRLTGEAPFPACIEDRAGTLEEKVGWLTGFEPATARSTIWGSNHAELQPPPSRETSQAAGERQRETLDLDPADAEPPPMMRPVGFNGTTRPLTPTLSPCGGDLSSTTQGAREDWAASRVGLSAEAQTPPTQPGFQVELKHSARGAGLI